MKARRIAGWLLVAAGMLAATAASAQTDSLFTSMEMPDSLVPATAGYRFSPTYINRITGNVSNVGMMNEFRASILTPYGPMVNFGVSKDEKDYRLQNRFEDNKRLSFGIIHTFRYDIRGGLTYNDSRVFNRSIAVGGTTQDFILNDRTLQAGATMQRTLHDLRLDGSLSGNVLESQRTYKNDQSLAGSANGGLGYNLIGDRVVVQARGAYAQSSDQSESAGTLYTGLGSGEDSLSSAVRVELSDSIDVRVDYNRYHGVRYYLDQAIGALGGQLAGAENVQPETETRDTRSTMISFNSQPLKALSIRLVATHDEQQFDYLVQTTRFSRTVGDGVRGNVSYVMPWRTSATVQFENRNNLRDLGPQSIASTKDKRKRVSVGLRHPLTRTMSVDLSGSMQLLQSFYLDYEANPRDRDQLDTTVNLRINSSVFKKVATNIALAYTATDFVNIDASQSTNNRSRQLWELRPGFTYTMNPRLSITQTYGLAIEYTDFVYQPEDNFLDRNITLTNQLNYSPSNHIRFRLDYGLTLHDSGSYLPIGPGGEDLLNVARKDRRDRMLLHMDYNITDHVGVYSEYQYNNFWDRDVETGDESRTPDGSIQVGTRGQYDWGQNRTLRFQLGKVKRFSRFGSDAEKDYWDMRSEFNYPF